MPERKLFNQKYYIILICFLMPATILLAQNTKKEDVLYLKNGSIIRGEIIEQNFGNNLKIELLGGSVFVFAENEIDSIRKETVTITDSKRNTEVFKKTKGYRNFTETGLIVGSEFNGYGTDWGVYLHSVNGYQWNRFLYTGAGVGLERYLTYQESFLPLYGRIAVDLLDKKATPYIFTDIGYAHFWSSNFDDGWGWQENHKERGGMYFSTGIGARIFTSRKISIVTGISYKRSTHHTEFDRWDGFVKQKITYNRMGINVGLSF
jgi:hypothetical protein